MNQVFERNMLWQALMNPPRQPGICDVDGTPLVQRADDTVETLRERLLVYHRNIEGLVPHYRAQGLLHEVDGEGEIENIYANIIRVLHPQAGSSC